MDSFTIIQSEARKIQEAIEVLNKNGLEHHIANLILQKELEVREIHMRIFDPTTKEPK